MLKSLWDKKLFKDHCNGRFRQTHNRPPIFYYYFTSELYDQIPADESAPGCIQLSVC